MHTEQSGSRFREHAVGLVAIAAAGLLLYHGLLTRQGILAHDGLDSYLRTWGYLRELAAGQLPPRLFPDAVWGGGYALPRFYPPLAYVVAATLAWLTGDIVLGHHLALLLSVLASGWAMYYLLVRLTGRRTYALAGALVYLSFPYRFTDVLQRAALAESFTFVWFPLLFAGAWDAIRSGRVPWYFPLCVAALLLTHVTTALYFVSVCAALALLARRHVPAGVTARLAAESLAGATLAGWFLLPMVSYLSTVWASDRGFMWATPEFADGNRLTVDLLVHRFAAPNGLDLGVGVLGLLVPVLAVLCWRRAPRAEALDWRVLRLAFALALTWVGLIAFMIAPLPALLVLPRQFAYIQFPWRLLGLAGFLAAVGVTIMAAALAPSGRGAIAALVAGGVLAAASRAAWRPVPKDPAWVSATVVEIGKGSYGEKGYTILGEYLPREATPDSIAARVHRVVERPLGPSAPALTAVGRDWVAELAPGPAREVVLPLVYYDLYRVTDGVGHRLPARSDRGLLAVQVGPETGRLRVSRARTPMELAGLGVSLLGAFALVLLHRRRAGVSGDIPAD